MSKLNEYLENIIRQCGGFGRFQCLLVVAILAAEIPVAWTILMMVFAGAIPEWRCNHFNITGNVSETTQWKTCILDNASKCQDFAFDSSMYTVVSQFELICDKSWITATATSVQMAGLFASSFVMGQVSDLIGRKPVLFISYFILCISNFIAAFSGSWKMFVVMRFFLGFGAGTYLDVYFILITEFVSNKVRPIVTAIPSWAISASLFGLLAYLLPHWKDLHIATAIFTAPFLLTWWIIPESFRWLVSNKRYVDAKAVITRMATVNRTAVPDLSTIQDIQLPSKVHKKYTVLHVLRSRFLMRNTLLQALMWFTCSYVFYAISFGVQDLSGNIYLNMFLVSAVGIPGDMLTAFTSNFLGRKWTAFGFLSIAGVASLVVAVVKSTVTDENLSGIIINAFALIAKSCVSAAWCAVFVLSTEVYPTVVRNVGLGVQYTAGRMGGIVAPQMVFLAQSVTGIMYYMSAVLLFVSSVCALLSPETKSMTIQDLIERPTKTEITVEISTESEHDMENVVLPVDQDDRNQSICKQL